MTHTERDGQARRPRLPDAGWLPDPSRMDIERFWDGTRWTARTRDRVSKLERIPAWEPVATRRQRSRGQRRPRLRQADRRGGGGGFLMIAVAVVLAVGGAGYVGALPSWVPWPTELTQGRPAGPDVAYPVFGSDDTVTYLARNLVAQKGDIDVTWIQASGGDVRSVVQDAMDEAMLQNPYAFVNGWTMSIEAARVRVEPDYSYLPDEAERRRAAIASSVAAITATPEVTGAPDDRTTIQAIHDAVLRTATYDHGAADAISAGDTSTDSPQVAQSQEAYGILVDGTAVCTGYARTFQLLAQASGLQSVVVTGIANSGVTTGGHAWNRVRVDGQWLVVDATWDDADDARLGTDYLMIGTQDPLMSTRSQDSDWVVDASVGMYGVG
jgi:hypothetical protein